MIKRILILTSITALALGCGGKQENAAKPAAQPLPADVQKVAAAIDTSASAGTTATTTGAQPAGSVASETGGTIIATGEFISPVRSELSAKIPGRVAKLYVDEGTRVSKGQPLLELETDYTRLNLEKAQADAARAAAAETDAQKDLDRKKELIAKQSIPQSTYDRTSAAYDQAKAMRMSAVAQVNIYKQQLDDSVLRSPIDGVVAEKRTDVGQRLGDNTVALVVVQTSPLKLRFRVPERDLANVHPGQTVKATVDPYPGVVFQGHVTTVGGVIDPASRSFFVETEFANHDGKLRPGLFARVEMEAGK